MNSGLAWGLLYLVGLLAALGLNYLIWERQDTDKIEWKKNLKAREAWKKMMEDKR